MSCSVSSNCINNGNRCFNCKFDNDGYSEYGDNLYSAIDRGIKHPVIEKRKGEHKASKAAERKEKKAGRDRDRVSILKMASKTEERVKSTLNSGRINKDGDLKTSDLVIDVKMQSTRKNPVINVDEFDKVNQDCLRSNKQHGVLCIENKEGKRFYVIGEDLFKSKFI